MVCSTIKFLHDLSSNRCKPGWFLSLGPRPLSSTKGGLRIASIFIILIGSLFGAGFPVLAARYHTIIKVPHAMFEFAKWFGSGVIIATAFVHLLAPATMELANECLAPAWNDYPYAIAFCLLSIFSIFIVELIAFRWGTAKLKKNRFYV